MGGGSSTKQVEKKVPTEEWYEQMIRSGLTGATGRGIPVYSGLTDLTSGFAGLSELDPNNPLSKSFLDAQPGLEALSRGEVPGEFLENMNKNTVDKMKQDMGSLIAGAANSGVINSTTSERGIGRIGEGATRAMNDNYARALQMAKEGILTPFNTRLEAMDKTQGTANKALSPAMDLYSLWRQSRYSVPSDTVVEQSGPFGK